MDSWRHISTLFSSSASNYLKLIPGNIFQQYWAWIHKIAWNWFLNAYISNIQVRCIKLLKIDSRRHIPQIFSSDAQNCLKWLMESYLSNIQLRCIKYSKIDSWRHISVIFRSDAWNRFKLIPADIFQQYSPQLNKIYKKTLYAYFNNIQLRCI